jgi:hypothetical protein
MKSQTVEEQIANACRYFNGIGNEYCEAKVKYTDVIQYPNDRPSVHPCFKENNISFSCTKAAFYTEEEVQQEVKKIDDLFAQVTSDLQNNICPTCKQPIEKRKQVGRCVYANPCGHRLYQGRI